MIGRLFQVTIPDVVLGADWIRVVGATTMSSPKQDAENPDDTEDIYLKCRYSRDSEYVGEDYISMDDFIDWIKSDIILDPNPATAAKVLLLGNKV
jgi:hypothetical protein